MKYYFLSDAHLGSRVVADAELHQRKLADWLRMASSDATAIFLLGDIFDFWFEFPNTIPPGYDVVLNAIREVTAKGIPVHFFCGNHDQWTFGYLEKHCGVTIHRKEFVVRLGEKTFYMRHGHALGKMSRTIRALNGIFESKTCQWLFRHLVPPRVAWAFGYRWSERNRIKHSEYDNKFQGENNEPLVVFAKRYSEEHPDIDYIVMGHRHLELNLKLATGAQFVLLGDFFSLYSYAVYDGETLSLEIF